MKLSNIKYIDNDPWLERKINKWMSFALGLFIRYDIEKKNAVASLFSDFLNFKYIIKGILFYSFCLLLWNKNRELLLSLMKCYVYGPFSFEPSLTFNVLSICLLLLVAILLVELVKNHTKLSICQNIGLTLILFAYFEFRNNNSELFSPILNDFGIRYSPQYEFTNSFFSITISDLYCLELFCALVFSIYFFFKDTYRNFTIWNARRQWI